MYMYYHDLFNMNPVISVVDTFVTILDYMCTHLHTFLTAISMTLLSKIMFYMKSSPPYLLGYEGKKLMLQLCISTISYLPSTNTL